MGDLRPLPRRQDIFVDERGVGLRLTWHPEHEIVVMSVWHGAVCTASFRLPVADISRLGGFLTSVLGDWAGEVLAARPHATGGGEEQRAAAANGGGHAGGEGGWQRRLGVFRPSRWLRA